MSFTGDDPSGPELTARRNQRRSRGRMSNGRSSFGRNSVGSVGSAKSAFQNVTDTLNDKKLTRDITETENSINALKNEISSVEQRIESRSQYEDIDTEFKEDDDYFLRHSRPRTYKPVFSLLFALICFIMFIASIVVNDWSIEDPKLNPLLGPSVETLIKIGAKETDLLQNGEVYRLVTPIFLQVGLIHLFVNLLGIFGISLPMEQEFGSIKVAAIALASGIAGTTLSALLAPNIVAVGASGALFGLVGAAWADLLQNWHIYRGKNTSMLVQLSVLTVLNFFFGIMPFVDNFAHLGGFVFGLIIGSVLLIKQYGEGKQRRSVQILLRISSVLVLPILVALMLFLLFLGFDVAGNCPGCAYISCVPFPPGVSEDNLWWSCGDCFNGFGSFDNFNDVTVNITCPNGNETIFAVGELSEEEFQNQFPNICNEVCPS